ncbi:MAG: ParB-like nuclease [Candidatus Magnetoglobus multicellularis str. Araruama]|uniref:ParB-like nuclease n=1 Tax=Candidatus Magnetoglobus multicellularis str. Araruama TaxID=890399 RepID=A0A1V1PDE6_9BACT|nr:MAG: ParB-like nuclease [Candidatus Magnetoglobus multicellularis str. Araruama]
MKIIKKNPVKLIPYARNNKEHTESQVKKIAASIREFGFQQPVVITNKGDIVIGHGRVLAAELLQLKEIPCVVAEDLNDSQIKALRIADNKLNESKWNEDMLILELQELTENSYDIKLTGFDNDELEFLLNTEDVDWEDMYKPAPPDENTGHGGEEGGGERGEKICPNCGAVL